jgi:hypothetical protein
MNILSKLVRFRHRPRGRLVGFVTLAVMAICLAGCSDFYAAPTARQQNVIGSVDVSTVICLDGFGANSNASTENYSPSTDCTDNTGTTLTDQEGFSEGQLLVGYLIPNGATAPTQLTSPDLAGVTFNQDADYSNYLTANETTPSGEYWVGYLSTDTTLSAAQLVHLDAVFTLPTSSDGTPYQGPFATQEVVGDRADGNDSGDFATNLDPNRPLDCSETDLLDGEETIATTGCVNDSNAVSITTRDLGIQAPSTTTIQAGTSGQVPFSLLYAGTADSTATFALTGSSDGQGISVTPADTQFTPTDNSTTPENVTVNVPAGLAAGTYHVTLTAADSDPSCSDQSACTRTATATITVSDAAAVAVVTPPAPPASTEPVVTPPMPTPVPPTAQKLLVKLVNVGRPNVAALLKHGESVRLSCNQACNVRLQLFVYYRAIHRGKQYARELRANVLRRSTKIIVGQRLVTLASAGSTTVMVKINRLAAQSLLTASSILLGITASPQQAGKYPTIVAKRKITVHGPNVLAEIHRRDRQR